MDINEFKTKTGKVGKAARAERKSASISKSESVDQIFELERVFSLAFLGAPLRLPNLGKGNVPFEGINVRKKDPAEKLLDPVHNPDCKGEPRGPEELCINDRGRIVFACMTIEGTIEEREPERWEFQPTDLEKVTSSFLIAAKLHLAKVNRNEKRWERLAKLSEEIAEVLVRNEDG